MAAFGQKCECPRAHLVYSYSSNRYFSGNARGSSSVFMPFGSGPRTCIGYELALLQLKAAIVHIVRKVKLAPTAEEVSVHGRESYSVVSRWMDGDKWMDKRVGGLTDGWMDG